MSRMLRFVSIGAAVQDVYLRGKIFEPNKEEDGSLSEEFALGTKNEVEAITFSTGGGATNASVTFARAGHHSSFMGRIGKDVAGRAVMDDLRSENINTTLVKTMQNTNTGYSTIFLSPDGERTILTYRGASQEYNLSSRDFFNVAPDWFYISSLSGDIDSLLKIVDYAKKHKIKIAINPGKKEITHKRFKKSLASFDILSLNKEEMQTLFGEDKKPDELLKEASKTTPIVLLTDGPKGSYATDGKKIFKAGMYKDVPVIDRLGAGDAFSSGFVCKVAGGSPIEEALVYASANSTHVVGQIGAKEGILHERTRLSHMEITSKDL